MKEPNWWERFRAWLAYLIFPEPNDWYVEACERANQLEKETEAMRDFMALLYLGIQEGRDEAFEALDDKTKKLINEVWFERLEEDGEDD